MFKIEIIDYDIKVSKLTKKYFLGFIPYNKWVYLNNRGKEFKFNKHSRNSQDNMFCLSRASSDGIYQAERFINKLKERKFK